MKLLASWRSPAGRARWRSFIVEQGVVSQFAGARRVGLVREDRGAHQHDPVAEGARLLVGADRDRDLGDQGLGGQLVVLEQPPPDGARADRDDDVVDGAAVLVLGRLDVVEVELAEGEPAVRRDAAVERGLRGAEVVWSTTRPSPPGDEALDAVGDAGDGAGAGDGAERGVVEVGQRRGEGRSRRIG